MQETIINFQTQLMHKIQFKASSKISLDAFLFKAFKFFDLYNNGYLSKNDFFKSIAKCGVVVETHNMDAVYSNYCNEQGNVNYKDFIQNLLFKQQPSQPQIQAVGLKSSQVNRNQQQIAINQNNEVPDPRQKLAKSQINSIYQKNQTYHEVLSSIKKNIIEDNSSLLHLAVKLKSGDPKKTHKLNKTQLKSALKHLNQQDLILIFKELSQDSKQIDYSILIYDLKGQIQQERLIEIENTFNMLDQRKERQFPLSYLLDRYLGKKNFEWFKKSVELYCQFQGIDDGVFTEEDFVDFMGFLSFNSLANDNFKNQFIRPFYQEDNLSVASHKSNRSRDFSHNGSRKNDQIDCRKNKDQPLEEKNYNIKPNTFDQFPEEHRNNFEKKSTKSAVSRHEGKYVSEDQIKEVESIILRIKKRLASKGTKGFLMFQKSLKGADINRDGCLSYEQFKMVIKDQRIDITSTQSDHIFKVFDESGLNLLNFNQLMFTLRGNMPNERKNLCESLWNRVRNGQETSNFAALKKRLHFRNHPDILNGRRHEQEIWKEIQDTILNIQELNGHSRKDTITQSEFQEYLQNLSLSIIDDKLFQTILYHFWRLQMSSDIKQQYAGSRKIFDPSKKSYLMDHHRQIIKGGSVSQNAPFGTSIQPTKYITQHRKI